jgi:hypothetical protein
VTFPKTIKRGSVRVTVYKTTRKRPGLPPYTTFRIVHYDTSGRQIVESNPDAAAAIGRAEEIAAHLAKGQTQHAQFTAADAASFLRAREIIGSRNIELVCSEYMDAIAALKGVPLATAVRGYLQRNPGASAIELESVIEEMLRAKEKEQASARWIEDLELRLARFSEAFRGPISELNGPDIEDWLADLTRITRAGTDSGLPVSPRSRKNYRTAVATLVAYAVRRKYLPREFEQEMEDVGFNKARSAPAQVYTPEEMSKLLDATAAHRWPSVASITPWLAVRAFAGVRHAEAGRMNIRRDIHPDENLIVLGADVTKTKQSRVIPMQGNLVLWLADFGALRSDTPLCDHAHPDDSLAIVFEQLGIEPHHNGLRDSYVSYRMAIVKDAGKVAQETGHSAAVLQSKYRSVRLPSGKLITETTAEEYFAIRPPAEKRP